MNASSSCTRSGDRLKVPLGSVINPENVPAGLQGSGHLHAKSTDGGQTWESPRIIVDDPGGNKNQTIGNQIWLVPAPPNGIVVDFFNEILNFKNNPWGRAPLRPLPRPALPSTGARRGKGKPIPGPPRCSRSRRSGRSASSNRHGRRDRDRGPDPGRWRWNGNPVRGSAGSTRCGGRCSSGFQPRRDLPSRSPWTAG